MDLATPQQRVTRKRYRLPQSCNHCRIRKLKCSRTTPCDSCARSGDTSTCAYTSIQNTRESTSTRGILEARIDKLEALLKGAIANNFKVPQSLPSSSSEPSSSSPRTPGDASLENNAPSSAGTPSSTTQSSKQETENLNDSFGLMHIEQDQTSRYIGSSHWVSVISEIAEFRAYIASNFGSDQDGSGNVDLTMPPLIKPPERTTSLLDGTNPPATREHLLSLVPPRAVSDHLLHIFFQDNLAPNRFIHEATFRRTYEEHWKDSSKTKITWLGMFFAMMHMAETAYDHESYKQHDLYSSIESLVYGNKELGQYREATIKCLIASDYSTPTTYTIETLVLHVETEWMQTRDVDVKLYAMFGMIIRLAIAMGYHSDSKRHAFTVFQAEMRRRLWAAIHADDILYSLQGSLPAFIRDGDSDCELPRNIRESDFDENSTELPPARDLSEPTEISFIISKYRRALMLSKANAYVESRKPIHPDQVEEYRKELQEIYNTTPHHLRMAGPEHVSQNPKYITQQQLSLDRGWQLANITIHRKFLASAHRSPTPQLLEFRRSCIDSAITLLHYQTMLFTEYFGNPSLAHTRHVFNLTSSDFYTADMAIALDLHFGVEYPSTNPGTSNDMQIWGYDKRPEMIKLLETSNAYWKMAKGESHDSYKAYQIFRYMLRKVKLALGMDVINSDEEQVGKTSASGTGKGIDGFQEMKEGDSPEWWLNMDEDQIMALDFDWNQWDETNEFSNFEPGIPNPNLPGVTGPF